MKTTRKATILVGAFGLAALTASCVQHRGEGGEGGRSNVVTFDPGGLIYEPPAIRVRGEGGEGGEGG